MKTLFRSIIVAACSIAAPSMAQEQISVAVGEYLPVVAQGDSGEIIGAMGEIVVQISNDLGFELTPEVMPFARLYNSIHDGSVDMAIGVLGTPQRREQAHYSVPIIIDHTLLAFAAGNDLDIQSISDLQDLRVGGIRGFSYPPLEGAGIEVEPAQDNDANIQKIAAGRLDVAVVASVGFLSQFDQTENADLIEVASVALGTVPLGIALADEKYDASFMEQLNERISAFLQTDEYAQILAKYNLTEYVKDYPLIQP